MLSLLFIQVLISYLSLSCGYVVYHWIDKTGKAGSPPRPLIYYLITGLVVYTLFSQWLILLFPMSGLPQVLILLIPAIFALTNQFPRFLSGLVRKMKSQGLLSLFAFAVCWIMILVLSSGPVIMDDTESYHIQNIKWIKEFGTVPGLVHLHERFAFNSSWFSAIALFNAEASSTNYYTALNGTISVWILGYCISLLAKKNSLAPGILTVFIVILLSWPLARGNAATANYDFMASVTIFVLFVETFRRFESGGQKTVTIEWVVWPAYLFTLRIINFPMLILAVVGLIFLLRNRQARQAWFAAIAAVLLIAPFLCRNVILSGFPFYPSMSFNYFHVDWKADAGRTGDLLHFIRYYNRVNTGIQSLETTASLSFPQWVGAWFRYMLTYDKIVFIPGFLGLVISFFIKPVRQMWATAPGWFFIAIIGQLLLWFFIAPDPRFIYGCLFCGLFTISVAIGRLVKWNPGRIPMQLFLIAIIAGLAPYTVIKITRHSSYQNWTKPYVLPRPPTIEFRVDGTSFHIPQKILNNWNPRCYATDLPCIYEADPRLRLRGNGIKNGFRLEK